MKTSLLILTTVFALTFAAPSSSIKNKQYQIHIPQKCDDVLAVKVCDRLYKLATKLKLKGQDVTDAVIKAVQEGKNKSEEIFDKAEEFLVENVLSKKCEDFTSVQTCNELRELAKKLHIKAHVALLAVIEAIDDGAIVAKDVYDKAVEYYKTQIITKTCEDLLTNEQCTKLRDISSKLKLKTEELQKVVVDAYVNAKTKGIEVVQGAIEEMKQIAINMKCEDLLNPDLCAALRRYAELTKVGLPKLMETAVNLLIKGYKVGMGLLNTIYKIVDYFYDCTDVFTESSCKRLTDLANLAGMKIEQFKEIFNKYVHEAVLTKIPLYNKILQYLKDNLYCKIASCLRDGNGDVIYEMRSNDEVKTKFVQYLDTLL